MTTRELTDEEVAAFQRATEELLEQTGFRVQHGPLLALARQAGARVDEASGRVRLPASLLRELLSQAPRQYQIAGPTGRRWTVGGPDRLCLAIVTDPWIVDRDSSQPRRPCLADVQRHTRIAQQLEAVAAISLMDYPVTDVDGPHSSLRALAAHLLEHDKHLYVLAASAERFARWLRLAPVLTAGAPLLGSRLLTVGVAVLSPLTLTQDNGELLLTACRHDLPVVPTVCPMAGTTAPFTKAGTLLQANAEVVFLAALTQIVRAGNPYLYVMGPSRTDMRTGEDLYYTLDKVLWKQASVQLGRAYGLPTAAECGGTTTCRYDLQSGAEGILFMLAAWASGADLLAGIGSCGNAVSMSGEMMLVQTAWMAAARFLGAGLGADLGAALASLQERGPGGQFLDAPETLAHLRTAEFFDHPLFDCEHGHQGGRSMLERARDQADALVADHRSPHPEAVQEGIRRFFREELAG